MYIFDTDSVTTTRLYAPGGSRDKPEFSISTDDSLKHTTLFRGPPGSGDVVAKVDYAGTLKRTQGKLGTVTFSGSEPLHIEEWLGHGKGKDSPPTLVKDGGEYVWRTRLEGNGNVKQPVIEVRTLWLHY
jgi:hypothetical protein